MCHCRGEILSLWCTKCGELKVYPKTTSFDLALAGQMRSGRRLTSLNGRRKHLVTLIVTRYLKEEEWFAMEGRSFIVGQQEVLQERAI